MAIEAVAGPVQSELASSSSKVVKEEATDYLQRFQRIQGEQAARHADYEELYCRYSGEYWQDGIETESGGMRIALEHLSSQVVKHIGLATFTPEIQVPPMRQTDKEKKRADKLEKVLYAVWEANAMDVQNLYATYYLSGMGTLILGALPDPQSEAKVRVDVLDPRDCWPVLSGLNYRDLRQMWTQSVLTGDEVRYRLGGNKSYEDDESYTLVQYWDEHKFALICLETEEVLRQRKHPLGKVPFAWAQNIPLPKEAHGLSDIEQSVGLVDYINDLFSYQAEITEYAANPTVVISGARHGSENFPAGPGGKIFTEIGGQARFLQWEGTPPSMEALLSHALQALQDQTGTMEALSGRLEGGQKSGAAITKLLTVGAQPRQRIKEMQAGKCYSQINGIVLRIFEKLWGDVGVTLTGSKKKKPFEVEIRAKDIAGYYRNYLIYRPGMFNWGEQVSTELQIMGSGLQSKYTTRENLGIRSPEDERQLIFGEMREDILLQEELNDELMRRRQPGEIAKEGKQLEKGGLPKKMQRFEDLLGSGKLSAGGGGAGGGGDGGGGDGGGEVDIGGGGAVGPGQPRALAGGDNPGDGGGIENAGLEADADISQLGTVGAGGGGEVGSGGAGGIQLSEIEGAVSGVELRGQAFVVGEIVTAGETAGDIEILVTVRSDVPKIKAALSNELGAEVLQQVHFGGTKGAPQEQSVELGAGVEAEAEVSRPEGGAGLME